MPKPRPNESRSDYVSRCVPIVINDGTAEGQEQAVAVCNSMWEESQKRMTNNTLVKLIRRRQQKRTEFAYGILTADQYVKTLLDTAGSDLCYRYGSRRTTSFADVLEKSAKTLVYSNQDMEVTDIYTKAKVPDGVELPKNCLMIFKHILTTPRKDRDGDILRSEGMDLDPKMLLLWQHVHTMPIGKMLAVAEHNSKRISLYSCIVDMNDMCHDAAVMVDNGMGRFSHGFRALEFDRVKARDGGEGGFDIKKGEIMEESLVSVPANVDADTEEVILSLVEGGKLTSPIMKEIGRSFKEHRAVSVPVKLNLKVTLNGQEVTCEEKEEGRGEVSTSEEADEGDRSEREKGQSADDEKVVEKKADQEEPESEGPVCPKCGSEDIKDGVCNECGAKVNADEEEEPEEEPEEEKKSADVKAGRVLSKANESKISDARDDIDEALKMDTPRACKALLSSAKRGLNDVLDSLGSAMEGEKDTGLKEAMAIVIAKATRADRAKLIDVFNHLNDVESRDDRVKQYLTFVGETRHDAE